MGDLESRLRATLHEQAADLSIRRMPPGTARALRLRQARSVVALATALAVAAFAAVVLLRLLPNGSNLYGPAGRPLLDPTHPIESVPAGWPRIDVLHPSDAYVIPRHVADADGRVKVLASGTVAGAEFSFMAWTGGREENGLAGPCIGFAGPWGGRTPPTDPTLQGFGGPITHTCAQWHEDPVPRGADLYLAGQRQPESVPGIAANYGVVSARVARLEVRLDGGSSTEVVILEGPRDWTDIRAFIFFPPADTNGSLTAFDSAGIALARAEICEGVDEGGAGGCGGPSEQLVPLPEQRS